MEEGGKVKKEQKQQKVSVVSHLITYSKELMEKSKKERKY